MIYVVNESTRRALDDVKPRAPRWRRETSLIAAREFASLAEATAAIAAAVPKRERDQWRAVTYDELAALISV